MSLFDTVPEDGEPRVPETAVLKFEKCIIENHRIVSVRVIKKELPKTEEE